METEWREVRRKGGGSSKGISSPTHSESELTAFYVSNLPGGIAKSELWKPCAKLGELGDIYIAGRKDRSGSFFAFVKYAKAIGKETCDAIVKGLKEIQIRGKLLAANCARHSRSAIQKAPRSFADVAKGVPAASVESNDPIAMDCVQEVKIWADKTVIVAPT
ncbi:hypothetical protein LXL04_010598 [Taraxacum kok-saghyz]